MVNLFNQRMKAPGPVTATTIAPATPMLRAYNPHPNYQPYVPVPPTPSDMPTNNAYRGLASTLPPVPQPAAPIAAAPDARLNASHLAVSPAMMQAYRPAAIAPPPVAAQQPAARPMPRNLTEAYQQAGGKGIISPETNRIADAAINAGRALSDNSTLGARQNVDIGIHKQNVANLQAFNQVGPYHGPIINDVAPRSEKIMGIPNSGPLGPGGSRSPADLRDIGLAAKYQERRQAINDAQVPDKPYYNSGISAADMPQAWNDYKKDTQAFGTALDRGERLLKDPGVWHGPSGRTREKESWELLGQTPEGQDAQKLIADSQARHTQAVLPMEERSRRVMARAMGVPFERLQNQGLIENASAARNEAGDMMAGSLLGTLHPEVARAYQVGQGLIGEANAHGQAMRDVAKIGTEGRLAETKQLGTNALDLGKQQGQQGMELQRAVQSGDLTRVQAIGAIEMQRARAMGASADQMQQLQMAHDLAMQQATATSQEKLEGMKIDASKSAGITQGLFGVAAQNPEMLDQLPTLFNQLSPQMGGNYGNGGTNATPGAPFNYTIPGVRPELQPGMPMREILKKQKVSKDELKILNDGKDTPAMLDIFKKYQVPWEYGSDYLKSTTGFWTASVDDPYGIGVLGALFSPARLAGAFVGRGKRVNNPRPGIPLPNQIGVR